MNAALASAAQEVVDLWETKLLAGAVNALEGALNDIQLASPELIQQAREIHLQEGQVEIDDVAAISTTKDGVWVQAWVFVSN